MPTDLASIIKLEVPVIVQVGLKRMSVDGVLALGPGAIVELDKSSDEELVLLVNNIPIGMGEAVKVGENFGLRVTSIDPPAERVLAMGGQDVDAQAMGDLPPVAESAMDLESEL